MEPQNQPLSISSTLSKYVETPILFTIPVIYEDRIIVRDKSKFLRIQELEKNYIELREKIKLVAHKHRVQSQRTKYAIDNSIEILNRCSKTRIKRAILPIDSWVLHSNPVKKQL